MQTRREYLAGLNPPLAKAKARGRLSREATAEIERAIASGMKFSDVHKNVENGEETLLVTDPGPAVYKPFPPQPEQRSIGRMVGYDSDGHKISSDICFRCKYHVNLCSCPAGIKGSSSIARWSKKSSQYGTPIDVPTGT
jgi:hypothetical protein